MITTPQACHQCGREIYFDGLCFQCRAENERNEILIYSQQDIEVKIDEICEEIKTLHNLKEKSHILKKLVNYRDINTNKIAETAFNSNIFYPGEIYKDAPEHIIKAMIAMVMKDDITELRTDHILLCLAAYGGDVVFNAFLELEKNPRNWRENLYVNPSFYATYGGWTFDGNGKYLEMQFNKCYPMIKGTLTEKELSSVKIGTKTEERCKSCGCQVVNLMEFNCRDSRLDFIGIDGVIKAKCCPNCFMYSEGDFCRYTPDGESQIIYDTDRPSEDNYLEDESVNKLIGNTYILGNEPVPLRYAADWEGGSSVGGFAFWIQDCEIKTCPDCGKPMKYLAQIQWDTVLDGMEGNAYIEICTDCKVMAILHQQT